ncbi:NADPH-dependent F420 reductase [Curtobacterium flaccumfaciens]|uniref:NADPH-dependent F420 reductase n=1 Tax=Curtobacterium flaccumfaciens TaxID=2035 RepID=UPI000DA9CCA2|nr:NAD(P)-binding domain-containing protein [Curtobacterium flaccumfaciens]MBO9050612.1 NAD(P)-binding domain-containing protein [Curtobacterium flaccumfaciens pv. flaccumfaciens]
MRLRRPTDAPDRPDHGSWRDTTRTTSGARTMTTTPIETLGIIGAGNVGAQIARRAIAVGLDVVLANSRGPETLESLIDELSPGAGAATVADAARAGDVVVVSIPINGYRDLPAEAFAGKVVVDTGNYYPEFFGPVDELEQGAVPTTSELLQRSLPDARVVKAFNNLGAADVTTDGSPAGTPGRRALTVAGDDADAKAVVTELLDRFGFDVVDVGSLGEGWRYERDQPAYGVRHDRAGMTAALAAATRR